MSSNILYSADLSKWCDRVGRIFSFSPTAYAEFKKDPARVLSESDLDSEIQISDGAKVKVSTFITSLDAVEYSQFMESVRPRIYKAGDGGSDGGDDGDQAGIASSVAVAMNVAVVGEVVAVAAAVSVVVQTGAVEGNVLGISAATNVQIDDTFRASEAYKALHEKDLSDSRKIALLKRKLIEVQPEGSSAELDFDGNKMLLSFTRSDRSIVIHGMCRS
jgi:hypothetical protein